jgi:HEPN domain-containing protein
MVDTNDSFAWVKLAEEDLAIVRSALRHKIPLIYPACFHAHQCAEKYLKALLISKNITFPKTHDLLMLTTICEEVGMLIPVDKKDLNTLNDYSVRVRYPGDNPSVENAREAYKIARYVRNYVSRSLSLK